MPESLGRQAVNDLLFRLTGHHLAKGAPGARVRQDKRQIEQLRKRVARLEIDLRSARRAKKRRFPTDYDDEALAIIRSVRGYTMTNHEKLHELIAATSYITRYEIPGNVVECGVWRGGSMHAVARALAKLGDTSRELYLFDTFEGMPPPTDADVRWDGTHAATLLESSDRQANIWAVATLDDVKTGFSAVPYPAEKIHYVQGKVEDTIPGALPERIAILRLDTDWYASTAHELAHAYDRLSPGGVLFIDDYGCWAGSRKATDEFIERTGEPLLLLRAGDGRVTIKPWATGRRSRGLAPEFVGYGPDQR